jgi:hypothetical protein
MQQKSTSINKQQLSQNLKKTWQEPEIITILINGGNVVDFQEDEVFMLELLVS